MLENKQIIEYRYPKRGLQAYQENSGQQYVSRSAQHNLVQWSNQASGVYEWTPGDEAAFTMNLIPIEQYSNFANMSIPYVTIHIGTTATTNSQIFPIVGGSANAADFQIMAGFDLLRVNDPYDSYYAVWIKNLGTVNYTLSFFGRWQYIQSNSGASE